MYQGRTQEFIQVVTFFFKRLLPHPLPVVPENHPETINSTDPGGGSQHSPPVMVNLCKKVPGKKVSGNKTLEKKTEFYQVLGKNVTGNKVLCFRFQGLFFLK